MSAGSSSPLQGPTKPTSDVDDNDFKLPFVRSFSLSLFVLIWLIFVALFTVLIPFCYNNRIKFTFVYRFTVISVALTVLRWLLGSFSVLNSFSHALFSPGALSVRRCL